MPELIAIVDTVYFAAGSKFREEQRQGAAKHFGTTLERTKKSIELLVKTVL